jgi:biotin transport system substrate-specific component
MKTRRLALAAVFAAIIAVLGPLAIPVGPVPLTLQTLILPLVATLTVAEVSLPATGLYLLLGAVGIPVFTGYSSGMAHLFGPTGGYLWGLLLFPLVIGFGSIMSRSWWWLTVLNLIAAGLQLAVGTVWYIIANQMTVGAGMAAGFTMFLLPGLLKVALVIFIAVIISRTIDLPLGE